MKVAKGGKFSGDVNRLQELVQLVPEERRIVAENLLSELRFMSATLEKLKEEVERSGVVEHFEQGKQKFMRESPALKAYNTTIQRYGGLYKQLTDMLPKQVVEPPKNALIEFIKQEQA